MPDLLSTIRERGYWQVVIRPQKFLPRRVEDISNLLPLLEKCAVQMRGWDFPHIDSHSPVGMALDYIWQETDWEDKKSVWRLYQSGQFAYVFSMAVDWRDISHWWPAPKGWQPMELLGVGDTLYTFAEIFELASRLALTAAGDETMHLSIQVRNTKDRQLYVDSTNRWGFDHTYRIGIPEYPIAVDKSRADLIANHRALAIDYAREFFLRFGWKASPEGLSAWLEKGR